MYITEAELLELKSIYKKHYGVEIPDEQANDIGNKLLSFFSVVGKRLPDDPQSDKK